MAYACVVPERVPRDQPVTSWCGRWRASEFDMAIARVRIPERMPAVSPRPDAHPPLRVERMIRRLQSSNAVCSTDETCCKHSLYVSRRHASSKSHASCDARSVSNS
eukprot:scaffold7994_cov122-Isochrysis_galbana.AAC.10